MSELARSHCNGEVLSEIAGKGDFPATARAIARLRTVAPREDSSLLALAGVILQDPGLSTKVLRVVNSAFYRPRDARVSTISRAVLLLGFDSIRNLATGILLIDSLLSQGISRAPLRENLCRALHTALLSQALAERIAYPAREEAYLLGLFARLGHLWLAAYYRDDYADALALAETEGLPLDDAICRVIGVKPGELAAAILARWDLPDNYVDHFRRAPGWGDARAEGTDRLHAVVEAASAHTASALPGDEPSAAWLVQAERTLGLRSETLGELVGRVDRAVREQIEALGLVTNEVGRTAKPGAQAGLAVKSSYPGSVAAGRRAVTRPQGRGAVPDSTAPSLIDLALATEIAAEISRAIVERAPLPSVLAAILEGVSRSGHLPTVVLALANANQDGLRVRLSVGAGADLASLAVPLRRDGGMLAEAALNRVACVVEQGSAALLAPAAGPIPQQDVGSFLAVPLLVRERLLGVLLAARPAAAAGVTSAELSVAQLFAQLACVACTAQLG